MQAKALIPLLLTFATAACSREGSGGSVSLGSSPNGSLFSMSRDTGKGFERVREVERRETVSLLRVETSYYGAPLDAFVYGWSCLNRLCKERGFTHWVVLEHDIARRGDLENPGNDWSVTVGLLQSSVDPSEIPKQFPEFANAKRNFSIRCAQDDPAENAPESILQMKDVWDVFSSIHFRFTK